MTDPKHEEAARASGGTSWIVVALAWIAVGVPMLWGVWMTLQKAALLFR